jgi:phosphinothricin acetyltransferase
MDVMVRPAAEADLAAITTIYNHYVVESPATFDIEPVTDRRAWFEQYSERGRHRLLVAYEDGIVGWTASSPLRPKPAYERSVETASVQLHREFGFERVGTFAELGWKFDRYWTVEWWERSL